MTKKEAAIISAYTGFLCGNFSDMHKYAEDVMGEPIFTHQFNSKEYWEKLKEKVKPDFIKLCENVTE